MILIEDFLITVKQIIDRKILLSYICSMTSLTEIKDTLKSNKQRLTDKYGLSFMAIFGSYGRGQQTDSSDIDILVDFQKPSI